MRLHLHPYEVEAIREAFGAWLREHGNSDDPDIRRTAKALLRVDGKLPTKETE